MSASRAVPPAWSHRLAFAAVLALGVWLVLWETFAPLRPGSAWLAVKAA